ncbi:hypothetical protein [Oceanobacillus locisalsi]|uniref:DUF3995 domain-containing protein n=1 Tax=Oceanobacillus locisalsi TaxID=546107 RepID=A0ABW3NIV7_9BACI
MDVLWEFIKLIGMLLFCLFVMFATWRFMQSDGKGWDDGSTGVYMSWPRSRLLNFFVFHLFFIGLLITIHNFFLAGFEMTSTLQHVEGYEGAGLAFIFLFVGATNLFGAKFLLGKEREGWVQKFDKIAPLFVRIFGAALILLSIIRLTASFG